MLIIKYVTKNEELAENHYLTAISKTIVRPN